MQKPVPSSPLQRHFDGVYIAPWIITAPHEEWEQVLHLGVRRSWPKKALVHDMGLPAHEIVLIRQGLLSIIASSRNGDQRTIGILGPGSILGEASLFCGLENNHIIRVVEPCEGVVFKKEIFLRDIFPHYCGVALSVCKNLATKCYIMSTQLECTTFMNGEQKIAHFLYHLAVEQEQTSQVYSQIAGLSLVSISELLGMHRVTVTNEINAFKKSGILAKDTDQLVIKDMEALLRILHGRR